MDNIKQLAMFDLKKITLDCPKHGRVETVSFSDTAMCPLCVEELEKQETEKENKEREKAIAIAKELRLHEMGIENEFFNKTLSDYIPKTASQEFAKKTVGELITKKQGKVILLGSNGLGKTMLGNIAVMALGGKTITMYEISAQIRQAYTPFATKSELEIVNELASTPMLFIDELSRSKGSNAELNWLSYILDKRHTRKLPFIISANAHLLKNCPHGGCENCFERFLGNDILSRLRQDTVIISLDGEDFRKGGKK